MQKKITVCLILVCMLFTSCAHGSQIDDLSFVKTIGLDIIDGCLCLTVGIELPEKESGSIKESGKSYSVACSSIPEGLNKIEADGKNKIFYGQISSVILGEEYAENGITECIDYFVRSNNFRFDLPVIVVKSATAKEIISVANSKNESASETFESLFDSVSKTSVSAKITLSKISEMLESPYLCPYLPYLTAVDNEIRLSGFCAITRDSVSAFLSETESRALSILNNTAGEYVSALPCADGSETVKASEIKTKKRLENGIVKITVSQSIEVLQDSSESGTEQLTSRLNDILTEEITETLNFLKSNNTDAAQLCLVYKNAGGTDYDRFLSIYPNVEFDITIESKISKEKTLAKPIKVN